MFNPDRNYSMPKTDFQFRQANWEQDIHDVSVEACEKHEDPMGLRVIYHHQAEDDAYSIGASYLNDRLKKLRRAGFDAPMTKKAINIIDQKRLKILKTAM